MGAIALHLLQAALMDVNTLMIQDVLADPALAEDHEERSTDLG